METIILFAPLVGRYPMRIWLETDRRKSGAVDCDQPVVPVGVPVVGRVSDI